MSRLLPLRTLRTAQIIIIQASGLQESMSHLLAASLPSGTNTCAGSKTQARIHPCVSLSSVVLTHS
ncbi:hypothetical protein BDW59DRAFT_154015 [Aspergillus cavernicola]|uniref:Uncharacterized protein n=1 Tax=Aspergillus cavernicola TaxID=176166 RepID=A0ABR4HK18_9EURO